MMNGDEGKRNSIRPWRLRMLFLLAVTALVVIAASSMYGVRVDDAFGPSSPPGEPMPTSTQPSRPTTDPSPSPTRAETSTPTTGPSPAPTRSDQPGANAETLARFRSECEKKVVNWRAGQVDYPENLRVRMNKTVTYNAAVDIRDDPLPADDVIDVPRGQSTSEKVAVQCVLAARLVGVGDDVTVSEPPEGGGWTYREFSPDGVAEWSWSVKATAPADQEVRLDLRPAVQLDGSPMAPITRVASFTTDLNVDANVLERVDHWRRTQWPLIAGIAATAGGAALAVKRWGGDLFRRKAKPKP